MKTMMLTIALVFSMIGLANQGEFVADIPEASYIPMGFDDNDNIQMVIEGYYRDSCQKEGPVQLEVLPNQSTINVLVLKYVEYSEVCLDVIQPYTRVIDFGVLPTGNYTVNIMNGNGQTKPMGMLPVTESNKNMPDEFIYAPVQESFVKYENGNATVYISGEIRNTCLEWDYAIVNRIDGSNVIDVLPILKKIKGKECYLSEFGRQFTQTIELGRVPKGRFLVNIRAMNGRSHFKVASFF